MPDVSRRDVQREVYHLLRRAGFRRKLTVRSGDGSYPIVVAVPSDMAIEVLGEVGAHGGDVNLVVPLADGLAVCAVQFGGAPEPRSSNADPILNDCTIGVFLARVLSDGGEGAYAFLVGPDDGSMGMAALTGVSG